MQRVLLHHDVTPALEARLAALRDQDIEVTVMRPGEEAAGAAALAEAEIFWHVLTPLGAGLIDAAPKLRLIQKIGVGVNTIDLDAARLREIAVCNMPGTNTQAVIEMTLLLMLACLRRLLPLDQAVRTGRGWALDESLIDGPGELRGRTVGLLGMGAVARGLVPVLQALGASPVYWNRTPKAEVGIPCLALGELLQSSDIISLHLPLAPGTERLLDAEAIASIKPGAILVNTARGGLVEEAALLKALESGRLAAAGLDVFAEEPLPADHPLLALRNVVLAPHVAWHTRETLERSFAVAIENCRRLRDGTALLHRVL
jgi:phosphoglycerate dehydrogenase-like enzyme